MVTFALVILLLPAGAPGAAETGLRLLPTHLTPTVAAGDETTEIVTLKNESAEDMTIIARIDFGRDATGPHPAISLEPEQLDLKPGESGKVSVKIAVAPEADAGEHRAVALFNAVPASGRDIAIVSQVSSLIDIDVIHPVDEVQWDVPFFVESGSDATFRVEARNSGRFTTELVEKVDLTGVTGTLHLESPPEAVDVGEQRQLSATWDDAPLIALKRATYSVGSSVGAPVEKKAFFIIFPWKIALAAGLILILSYMGFLRLRRH